MDGNSVLNAFALTDDALAGKIPLESAPGSPNQQVLLLTMRDGGKELVWLNGQRVSAYEGRGDVWTRRLTAVVPWAQFSYFPITNGSSFVDAVAALSAPGAIYSFIGGTGALSDPANVSPVMGKPGAVPMGPNAGCLVSYLGRSARGDSVESLLYDFPTGTWAGRAFPSTPGDVIKDAWFGSGTGSWLAADLAERADGLHLKIYRADPSMAAYVPAVDVLLPPSDPATVGRTVSADLLPGGVLVLKAAGAQLAVDVTSWVVEWLAGSDVLLSVDSNGRGLYLLSSSDGARLMEKGM